MKNRNRIKKQTNDKISGMVEGEGIYATDNVFIRIFCFVIHFSFV